MPADAPLRRAPRRRPRPVTTRGPQGLPTQAKSLARPAPRPKAPARPPARPSLPASHRGPQGLAGPRTPVITKSTRSARHAELRRRAAVQRAARKTRTFGTPKAPTFGMSKQAFDRAKARGNKEYANEQAKKPSFKRDLANIGHALSNTSDFLEHVAQKAHLSPGVELPGVKEARHKAVTAIGNAPIKAAEKINAGIPIRQQSNVERAMGIQPGKVGRETIDLVASVPTSTYLAGKALHEGVVEHDWRRGRKLVKDYNDTSAVAAAAHGHWREALNRANERPVSTAIEVGGLKAVIGRGAGAGMRSGLLGKTAKHAASTKRANLRLYPEAKPGQGPEVGRDYSRDVINKAVQKLHERSVRKGSRVRKDGTQRRPGRDPNVDYGSFLAPRLPGRQEARGVITQPNRSRLMRQADSDVHGLENARRKRIEKTREAVSRIVGTPRKSRYPGGKRKGMVKHEEAAGVQLVAEGTVRVQHIRADLKKRRLALVKEAPRLKREDPARYELNVQERQQIARLESLSDEALTQRIPEAAKALHEQQASVQARGRKVGAWDELGQSKRFYPALQSHVRNQARIEGPHVDVGVTPRRPANVKMTKAERDAQLRATERPAVGAAVKTRRTPAEQRQMAKSLVQRANKGRPLPPKAQAILEQSARERVAPAAHKLPSWSKINPKSLQVLADQMGLDHPVAIRDLTPTMRQRGTRSALVKGLRRDAHDNIERHVIYIDKNHGPGAQQAALIHELQHAADADARARFVPEPYVKPGEVPGGPAAATAAAARAIAANEHFRQHGKLPEWAKVAKDLKVTRKQKPPPPSPHEGTTGLTEAQYRNLPSEQRANAAMNRYGDRHDLFDEPALQEILRAAGRPKVGKKQAVTRGDLRKYVQRVQNKQHVPASSLHPAQLEEMARQLQRRERQGKETLPSLKGHSPTLITQRVPRLAADGADTGLYRPPFPRADMPGQSRAGTAFAEGSREVGGDAIMRQALQAETTVTAAEAFQYLARKYGMAAGEQGKLYASSYSDALARAQQYDTRMVPVNIAEFTKFGNKLRRAQNEAAPGGRLDIAHEQDILRQAWDSAMNEESGRGKWVLFPEDVVQRFRDHAKVGTHRTMNQATNLFKDVVLTTSSPAHWIGGNVGDLGVRSIFEGLTPLDVVRGAKINHRTEKLGIQGEVAAANTAGGGLYHVADRVGRMFRAERVNEPLARTVLAAPYRTWKTGVYALEHAIEVLPQYGATGKQFRRDTELGRMDGLMKRDLKKLSGLQDELIDKYAYDMANDFAVSAKVQKKVEDVIGRWGKVSPSMRRALVVAPFAQWLGAATRYVYLTLPAHHPIKTAILAGVNEMTLKERQRLGLSYILPRNAQAQDYQMGTIPLSVGQNKYGVTVSGIRTSRMTSFGTAAFAPNELQNFILPQFSGALDALAGQSYTGEQLLYPDWWPDPNLVGTPIPPSDRYKIGLGALMESTIPFASMFRRTVLENGRPSDPSSTVLTPRTRKRYNKDTGKYEDYPAAKREGLLEWLMPYSPPSRVMTYGAVKAIREQGVTGRTLDRWRESAKKAKATRNRVGVPLRDKSAVVPARQQDGGVIDLRGSDVNAPTPAEKKARDKMRSSGVIDLR